MGIIYKATNKLNNKIYIGQTLYSLAKRKAQHKYSIYELKLKNKFYNAIRKYGWDNFQWEIIFDNVEPENLGHIEKISILKYDTLKNGYNSTTGGEKYEVSETTRKKISNANIGKKLSKETKNKISKSNSGKIRTKENRLKISAACKGIIPWNKGKKYSEEIKNNISIGHSCLWEIFMPNGSVKIISNLANYCKVNNLNQGHMISVSQGRLKSHKGYRCNKISGDKNGQSQTSN